MTTVMIRNTRRVEPEGVTERLYEPGELMAELRAWCAKYVGDACEWRVYEGGEEGGPSGTEIDDQTGGLRTYWVVFVTIEDRALALRLKEVPRWQSVLMEGEEWDRIPADLARRGLRR